ncbi:hypothetical protein HGM15179_019031 [Zosterops borbonicus]|uniref:Uncharacterized protein n=1 Tax=Zosterops borbonicus TaxID=364589 RepID=A0A8K1DBS5_9PASS|nr:hypothetical protein HGM15179_019031 [Zosterops borbonicus]
MVVGEDLELPLALDLWKELGVAPALALPCLPEHWDHLSTWTTIPIPGDQWDFQSNISLLLRIIWMIQTQALPDFTGVGASMEGKK